MNQVRNIIVTGSNKGIGYGIVNHLAKSQNWNIIMACRNVELANQARDEILAKNPGSNIHVEQLDVSDPKSIDAFIPLIKQKYQHIDVLVNNAGVAAKGDAFDVDVYNFTFSTVINLINQELFRNN
jgi:NAD(P)-dependent dehydrogenase (short-subunit alcohol dehydrogenase family)